MNISTGSTASLPNVTVMGNITDSDGDGKDAHDVAGLLASA